MSEIKFSRFFATTSILHIHAEFNLFVGSQFEIYLFHLFVDEFIHHVVDKARHTERYFQTSSRRHIDSTFSSDVIFTAYSHAKSHRSITFSSIAEFRHTAHVVEQLSIEFIPSSTRVVHICFTIFHFDCISTSRLVSSRSSSFHSFSFQRDCLFCDKCNIQLIEFCSSKVAIIHHFVDAHTSRDSEECWQSHVEWTSQRHHHTHPSQAIRLVGQCEFHLLFVFLHILDVEAEPLSITGINNSTFCPIKHASVVATKTETIVNIDTESDRFVCSHLDIHLFNLWIEGFIEQFTDKI